MQLEYLKYLISINQLHSLTKAADSHFISRQALSKNLSSLETELNQKLYTTIGKKVYLTPAGEIVAEFAQKVIENEKQMNEKLSLLETKSTSPISLNILSFSAISNFCINHIFDFSKYAGSSFDITCRIISPTSISQASKMIETCSEDVIFITLNTNSLDIFLQKISSFIDSYEVILNDQIMLCIPHTSLLTNEAILTSFRNSDLENPSNICYAIYSICIDDRYSLFHQYTNISSDTDFIKNLLLTNNIAAAIPYYLATKHFDSKTYRYIRLDQKYPLSHLIIFKNAFPYSNQLVTYIKNKL